MRFVFCAVYVFVGALLFALPNMTRRELLFAVPVPPDFRESCAGRHAIRMFRAAVSIAALAGVFALLFSPTELLDEIAALMPTAIFLVGRASFYWQHRSLAPMAVQYKRPREAEISAEPEELPGLTWIAAAGPFVILSVAAVFLAAHWDRIPTRFPVHFDVSGQPNRWVARTFKGVYGPLIFGAELCTWFVLMSVAGWFGSRRSHARRVMLTGLIGVEYSLASLFALIALQPVLGIPAWVVVLAPMAVLIPMIVLLINKLSEPSDPMDPTPNECWKGGIIYFNPDDAALFVEKRDGFGYTMNFANHWSWILLLSLAMVIASAPLIIA